MTDRSGMILLRKSEKGQKWITIICGCFSSYQNTVNIRKNSMNIQIFGTKKCNDTKKAQRFFKERGIKFQFIDMKEKGMSKGEFNSYCDNHYGLEEK